MDNDDYDSIRKQNIAERNKVFAEFFKDLKEQTGELKKSRSTNDAASPDNTENEPPKKRRRTSTGDQENFRGKNVRLEFRKKYHTRSRAKNANGDELNGSKTDNDHASGTPGKKGKLRVLFPWAKPFQRSIDLMKTGVCDVDEEEEDEELKEEEEYYDSDQSEDYTEKRKVYRVTRAPYDPNTIPSVDEITEEMLANVAVRSTLKEYCKIRGTSCHQCRQKTVDVKTVCRSGECIGLRGMFCGPCLRGRYGESAVEALQDPNWACPPCRGLCNCSICRTRSGLRPTGILAPVAQEEGFSSVMEYLQVAENDDT